MSGEWYGDCQVLIEPLEALPSSAGYPVVRVQQPQQERDIMSEERLYGTKDGDNLYLDLDMAIDYALDCFEDVEGGEDLSLVVEEWSVFTPITHLPSAEYIVSWIAEWSGDGEIGEHWYELFPMKDKKVLEASESLRRAISDAVTYFTADRLVARHTVAFSIDADGSVSGYATVREQV